MFSLDIAHRRLHTEEITRRTLETPQALVEWLGAVQAQDYAAAKWALGLRLLGTYPSRQRRCASEPSQLANEATPLLLRSQASCKAYCAQSGGTSGEGVTDD